jgi:hypothetical protein
MLKELLSALYAFIDFICTRFYSILKKTIDTLSTFCWVDAAFKNRKPLSSGKLQLPAIFEGWQVTKTKRSKDSLKITVIDIYTVFSNENHSHRSHSLKFNKISLYYRENILPTVL